MVRLTYRGSETMTEDGCIRPSYSCYSTRKIIERLAEYEDAEEQGLLVRLPVKVGDTVYVLYKNIVTEKQVYDVQYRGGITYQNGQRWYVNIGGLAYYETDFGKTVFLTQEEAEQKLKEKEMGIRPSYSNYSTKKIIERLAEYEDLEEKGLLLRLPCKVGDTVYHVVQGRIIEVSNVDLFFLLLSVAENRFNNSVFLTQEEAEQKLKEMESD